MVFGTDPETELFKMETTLKELEKGKKRPTLSRLI